MAAFFKHQPNNNEFTIAISGAKSKIDIGMLKSALDEMLIALRDFDNPLRIMVAYNLGAIYWAQIGNGEKAREYYKMVVSEAEKYGIAKVDKIFPSMVANVFENMMHLSLSYEEFFYWEYKMRELQPFDNVLKSITSRN